MFPWLRLASDADWNIPTKRFEPEKGVDLYGRYMSKSGFLGQSYRPRLIRRVDLYAGIYGNLNVVIHAQYISSCEVLCGDLSHVNGKLLLALICLELSFP